MQHHRPSEGTEAQEPPYYRTQRYVKDAFCPDPVSRDEEEHDWAISGTILSILWGDMYPKMIAQALNGVIPWPDPGEELAAWFDNHLDTLQPSPSRPFSEFIRRRDVLRKYFQNSDHIPTTFRGWGSYDFILSDQGLDLFAPPPLLDYDPGNPSWELFHFYQIRSTGEPPIGMPTFMDSAVRTISMDAPEGPAQVYLPTEAIETLMECLCPDGTGRRPEPAETISFSRIAESLGTNREWWMEGSVIRGVLIHLPRIVATIWYEDQLGAAGAFSYRTRYSIPGDNGLRRIFAERMESSLPSAKEMEFEQQAPVPPPAFDNVTLNPDPVACATSSNPQSGDPDQTQLWEVNDIMVTARGIFVPRLSAAPNGQNMLNAVAQGRAGNPVFTSTWLCNAI